MYKLILLYQFLFLYSSLTAQKAEFTIYGKIRDEYTQQGLEFATVSFQSEQGKFYGVITNEEGVFIVRQMERGHYKISISFVGYPLFTQELQLDKNDSLYFYLRPQATELTEVVVTATESKGLNSSTQIDREAMNHRQPSSFSDLLSLLPGGMSSTPNLSSASLVRLRQAGNGGDEYDISSLGTAFLIDGHRLPTDANMQKVVQISSGTTDSHDNLEFANKGIDMRAISTDQIESVEIVRGLASVEYGDLTSGLIKINRKKGYTPWDARFKADQYAKLFALGKGTELKERKLTLNAGLDYTDTRPDPRDDFSTYKRLTGSIRINKNGTFSRAQLYWGLTADYTGSFDNQKSDPEVTLQREDRYKASYNALSLGNTLSIDFLGRQLLKRIEFNTFLSFQKDQIRQTKFVQLDRDRVIPNSIEEGEHDGEILPYKYTAHLLVDGQPFRASAKLKANLEISGENILHRILIGTEWSMDKNYGQGQVYDINRPLNPTTSLRPTTFRDIPAGHKYAVFAEDHIRVPIGYHQLEVIGGIRGSMLFNLSSRYRIQNKMYFDPRISAQWNFPGIGQSKTLYVSISGSIGWQTKMPTLQQLHPYYYYSDIMQLNYYNLNPDFKRINILTHITDPTNYHLKPASNRKGEIKMDLSYQKSQLTVTYFKEFLNSGFRNSTITQPYIYKKYDPSSIDDSQLQGPPDLADISWQPDTILGNHSRVTNGSFLGKEGIEFQFISPRLEGLKTKLTINGAWFRTTYKNSEPVFYAVNKIVNNTPINDKYLGYYDWIDGSEKQQFNTTFILDTYFKPLGLTLSLWTECMWFNSSRRFKQNGRPIAYMDVTGVMHPYTEEDQKDTYKQWLIKTFNDELFKKTTEPFYMYVNFKASKDFGKFLNLSLYVDRILDYSPDYESNGYTIRRNVNPYFGMEITLKL